MTDLTVLRGGGGDAVASALRHADLNPAATRRREVVFQDPVASFERAVGMTGLEQMQAIAAGELPPPPIAVLMNLAPQEVERERVVSPASPARSTTTRSA